MNFINTFFFKKFLFSKRENGFFSLINIITISSIAVGVAVLILALQILSGFENSVEKLSKSFDSHIKIIGYSNNKLDYNSSIAGIQNKFKEVETLEKFISQYVVIKSKSYSDGILLIGLENKKTYNNASKFIVSGMMPKNQSEIIIGVNTAERMQINIGDFITLFALNNKQFSNEENLPNIEQYKVVGIFKSGMHYYDNEIGFINLESAKNLFSFPDNFYSGFNIYLSDYSFAHKIQNELKDELPYPFWVRTIEEIHRNIFVWLELQKEPIPIVLTAILLVSSFNIIGALLILILKRRKTIGVLLTLGMKRKNINQIFLLQGVFLTTISALIGIFLAIFLSFLQNNFNLISLPSDIYFISQVKISYEVSTYLIVFIGTFLLGTTISLIPSRITNKFSPIQILKSF